jgi:thiamine biosynthesis lipoprotein
MTDAAAAVSGGSDAAMRRMQPLLGTFVEVCAAGDPERLGAAVQRAFGAVRRVQALMSYHDAHSDVARINRAGTGVPVPVSPDTWRVLRFSQRLARLSAQCFQVTHAATLVASGALPPPPGLTGAGGLQAVEPCGELELLPDRSVRWRRRGLVELGGIAKGFAVDCAIEALRRSGVRQGLVNAGGDLRCFGEAQPIHLRAPDGSAVFIGWLSDAAIATSGDSAQPAAGALVDPANGTCERWGASISVAARSCTAADALTKIVRLAPERAPRLLRRMAARAYWLEPGGRLRVCGELHAGSLA